MVPSWLMQRVVPLAGIVALMTIVPPHEVSADDQAPVDLSQHFGFGPLEIFKLERRSQSMLAGDFNNDGRTDLVLIDNSHSRLDLLLQREGPPAEDELPTLSEVNQIGSHWRFEHKKIPIDRNAQALAVGDFNADGRTDLAYFDDGDRLTIRFQPEDGDWKDRLVIRLADVDAQPWRLAAGDLNNDGKTDLVVLGKRLTYVLHQTEPGQFATPVQIRNTADQLGLAMIADIDGDGRNDLFYLANDVDSRKASARLQNEAGQLGPELRFDLKDTRGITLYDIVEGAGVEILSIDGTTGRMQVSQFDRENTGEDGLDVRMVQYGFGDSTNPKGRDLATGDIDGDGLIDVLVTDPDAAQIILFRQDRVNGLDAGTAYPSFLGVQQIQIAATGPGGAAEAFVLSTKEKSLGVARMDEGRLTFPTSLPISGEPVAFALVDQDQDGTPELLVLEKVRRGQYALRQLKRKGREWKPAGDEPLVELESSNEPGSIQALDANRDGRTDLVLISDVGREPTLLLATEDGKFEVARTEGGVQIGQIGRGSIFSGTLDDPVTLVAQDNFARSLRLDESNRWQVLDQFNPAASGAKIVGAATLDLDGQEGNELVLIDGGLNKLRVLRKEGMQYLPWEQVDLGAFPYIAARVVDLNGDGRDDLLLFGASRFVVLYAGERPPVLNMVATFESKLDDVFFVDLVAGDLNGDGEPDIALFDTRKHRVEIVTRRGNDLVHAINFRVFEEKGFGRQRSDGMQPREGVIADVTGDGRDDLILLVHDRVIVYPQDDGSSSGEVTQAAAKP
jgi:hypothetical protein